VVGAYPNGEAAPLPAIRRVVRNRQFDPFGTFAPGRGACRTEGASFNQGFQLTIMAMRPDLAMTTNRRRRSSGGGTCVRALTNRRRR
jgi:hypothetical protein